MRHRRRMTSSRRRPAMSLRKKRVLLIAIVVIGFLFYLDHTMSAVVDRAIINNKTNLGSSLLNEAIFSTLDEVGTLDTTEFIFLTYKEDQTVATIQTNTAQINHLNAVLTRSLLTQLKSMEAQKVQLPAGSLTDSPLLQGRGPTVRFKFQPGGTMNTSIRSDFSGAGINQTSHQILIDVSVEMACVGLLRQRTTTVETQYLVAETIIVGEIPESYSQILLTDQNRIGADLSTLQ